MLNLKLCDLRCRFHLHNFRNCKDLLSAYIAWTENSLYSKLMEVNSLRLFIWIIPEHTNNVSEQLEWTVSNYLYELFQHKSLISMNTFCLNDLFQNSLIVLVNGLSEQFKIIYTYSSTNQFCQWTAQLNNLKVFKLVMSMMD